MKLRSLAGQVVVVTGASSGVGRAIAIACAKRGARVALIARGSDGLAGAAREVVHAGGEAFALPVDVTDAHAVEDAADRVVARWGRIDAWVNDAMLTVLARIVDTTPDEFRRVTEATYLGYVHGTRAALRHMRVRDRGTIVQIGSALAYRSIPLQAAYCGAKAAIRGFTDSLRSELHHDGSRVRVTMVQLPAVNTPQFDVMRHRLPGHPRPVPPIYQPEVIADEVARILTGRVPRERWIGWSTVAAIVGQRVIPGLLDRYLARKAWNSQFTRRLASPVQDNLVAPLAGDRGAHGAFDRESRRRTSELWLRHHAKSLAAGALVASLGWAGARALR